MRKSFFLMLMIILTVSAGHAQNKVRGVVYGDRQSTIPGASVFVKGSINGTITDINGNYALVNVNKGDTLSFSFVGFNTTEIAFSGQEVLDVTLSIEDKQLEEVVVTAMGIKQQKKKIGYTTQQINEDVIENANPVNVGNALSGQIAGLTVSNPTGIFQAPSFSLRGKTPMIVLDGVPVESNLYDLNSSDISSVNVLKGTSASALYGARGKNGAILITTKKAKENGVTVTIDLQSMASAGFTVFPDTQTEFGSGSQGQYEFWDGADGGISDGDMTWGPRFSSNLLIAQWNSPIRNKETGETIDWWGDVSGSIYDDRSLYERVPIPFVRHDNLKNFLRTGLINKGSFSVASKKDGANTYVSGNYLNQRGQVPNTSLNTGGITFNGDYQILDHVNFQTKLSYNKVYSPNYPRYGYGPKNHIYTILLWMSDDVDIRELKKHMYRPDSYGYRQANYNYAWYNNPYFMAYEATNSQDRNVMTALGSLTWDILPTLSVRARSSARLDNAFEDMKVPKSYMNYGDSRNGDYKTWNEGTTDINSDIMISYTQATTSNINLALNVGASSYYKKHHTEYQTTDGLSVPFVYNMSNSTGAYSTTNELSEQAINSIYGTANLDLFGYLYLTLTGRNDWSSTLPKENSSYFYPSVAASSVVSDYANMPLFLDYLKVFGSWAKVSSDLDPYQLQATYNQGVMYGSTPSVDYPSSLVNPEIKAQTSTSFEAGLSFAVLSNRLAFDFTYYNVVDENQIIDLSISEASGFTSRTVNGNEYTTNGLEFVVMAKPVVKKDFSWGITANASHKVRKLTAIYDDATNYGNLKLGDRADAAYATVWSKSAEGKLIVGTDGMPIFDEYKANVGNYDPDWRFGFQNTFKIKNWKVNMDIDGAIGGLLISTTHQKLWWAGKHENSTKYRDEEYATGAPVFVPNAVVVTGGTLSRDVNGNVSSDTRTYINNETAVDWQSWCQNYPYRAVVTADDDEFFANTFSRSFVKLRRLSVGYDLASILNLGKIKGLDLTLFGDNLLVLKKMPYLDPDFGSSDSNLQDPSSRYLGISANIKF
ncbi:MAG: SusC/RagA family TonB-linked outer membrane protein [Mangrovibacterium sp.]